MSSYYKKTTFAQKILKILQLYVHALRLSPREQSKQQKHPSILMVVSKFDRIGGLEKQAFTLSAALARRSCLITVLTDRIDGSPAQEIYSGFLIRRFSASTHRVRLLLSLMLFFLQHRQSFQIVHAHGVTGFTLFSVFLAKLVKLPVLLKGATRDDFTNMFRRTDFKHRMYQKCILKADRLIAISAEMEKEISGCGISKDRIVTIPNAVDCDIYSPATRERKEDLRMKYSVPNDELIFLSLGRLEARKGIDILLQAWQQKSCGHLWIVGSGSELNRLQSMANDLKLLKVRFFGGTTFPLDYYHCADVFVLPSWKEGLPGSVLEAMGCGLACICTRIGGVVDQLKDREHGLLVAPGSVPELADALEHAATNGQDRETWGKAARAEALRRFDVSRISDDYLMLYRSLSERQFR